MGQQPAPGGWRAPESRASVAGYTSVRGVAVDRAGALVAAREDSSGRPVLIRVLSPALASDAGYLRRLRRDLAKTIGLRHPNLVGVIGYDDSARALVYESVDGVSARRLLEGGAAMPPAAATLLLDDCLAGLGALHRLQVVHRDVRPDAVLIDARGVALLRDAAAPCPPLRAGWRAGTPQYMAPELWAGDDHSPASDFYAATCVFVEVLRGLPAFPATDLEALRREHESEEIPDQGLPPAMHGVIAEGLATEPEDRPIDASSFRADLAAAAETLLGPAWRDAGRAWLAAAAAQAPAPASPPPVTPVAPYGVPEPATESGAAPWWRRPRTFAAMAAAVAAVAVVVLVAAAAGGTPPSGAGPAGGPLVTATPGVTVAPVSATPLPSGSPASAASQAAAAPTAPPTIAPDTQQPSLGPAVTPTPTVAGGPTPTATPTPTPSPTATPCLTPPICP